MEGIQGYNTISQVAEQLGLSEGAVRRLISDGKLAVATLPGTKRPKLIPTTEIERYQQERKPRGWPAGRARSASAKENR